MIILTYNQILQIISRTLVINKMIWFNRMIVMILEKYRKNTKQLINIKVKILTLTLKIYKIKFKKM